MAQRKKAMIKEGKLDRHGKPNDKTPSDFTSSYKDYSKSNPPQLAGDGPATATVTAATSPATTSKRAKESDGNSSDEQPAKKKDKKEKKEKKEKKKKKKKEQ